MVLTQHRWHVRLMDVFVATANPGSTFVNLFSFSCISHTTDSNKIGSLYILKKIKSFLTRLIQLLTPLQFNAVCVSCSPRSLMYTTDTHHIGHKTFLEARLQILEIPCALGGLS